MFPKFVLLISLLLSIEVLARSPASSGGTAQGISRPSENHSAQDVINQLGLAPSVEKGYYLENFRDPALSVSTAIYYLLEGAVGKSYWHRVDAAEVWHYYAGAPLSLYLSLDDGQPVRERLLGPDIFRNQTPQVVVAAHEWQQALSHGKWTLVGTTGKSPLFLCGIYSSWVLLICINETVRLTVLAVAPAFVDSGFELAPSGWQPNGA
ncbi:cupin family protein [Rutstroemia sp. NJR-2017a WRK4]|nr:cupin family protein [Rutstroemia sp. NJR-2017a WRK4]